MKWAFVGRFCETPPKGIGVRRGERPTIIRVFGILDCVLGTVEPLPYKNNYHG